MKYNTLRIIRQLLKNELEGMEREMTVLNNDLKKLVPETDPRVKMRKTASDWRYELECALKDFDAQDWK